MQDVKLEAESLCRTQFGQKGAVQSPKYVLIPQHVIYISVNCTYVQHVQMFVCDLREKVTDVSVSHHDRSKRRKD